MALFINLPPELIHMIINDLHPHDAARLSLVSSYLDTVIQPLWPTLLKIKGMEDDTLYASRLELPTLLLIRPSLARHMQYFEFLWCRWKYYHFASSNQRNLGPMTFLDDDQVYRARMFLQSGEGYSHVTEAGAHPFEEVGRGVFHLLPLLTSLTTIKIRVCCHSNILRDALLKAVSGSRGLLLWPKLSRLILSQCHLVGHQNAVVDDLVLSFLDQSILKGVTTKRPVKIDKRSRFSEACNIKCLELIKTNIAFHTEFPVILGEFSVLRKLTIYLRQSKTRKLLGSAQVLADALATVKDTLEELHIIIPFSELSPISMFMGYSPRQKQIGSLQNFKRLRVISAPIQLLLWSPLDEVGEFLTDGLFLPTLFRHILPSTLENLRLQEVRWATTKHHEAAFRDLFRHKKKFPDLKFISINRASKTSEEDRFVQLGKEAEAAGISIHEDSNRMEPAD